MNRINILNIKVDNYSTDELLKSLEKGVVITPNVDHLIKLQRDEEFYRLYHQAEYVIVDSKIVQLGLRFLGTPVKEVVPGSDFFPAFCDYHKNNDEIKIFLLGAAEGVANKAMQKINKKLGKKRIIGVCSPSYGFEENISECNKIIEEINQSGANVLAVGVGAPKQEKWIFKHKKFLTNIDIYMAIGATIDFEAGNVKRAPNLFKRLGMEWFYRLMMEPKRLWKRYLIDDIPFFYFVALQRLNLYKDPFSKTHL